MHFPRNEVLECLFKSGPRRARSQTGMFLHDTDLIKERNKSSITQIAKVLTMYHVEI
jgi:hypothetical protein